MARMLIFMTAVICAAGFTVLPSGAGEMAAAAGVDRISIECRETNTGFAVTIQYTASRSRIILANVIDSRGEGHRIMRRTVRPGSSTINWTCRKDRFGPLSRGCVAMHKTSGRKETVAWDCDNF